MQLSKVVVTDIRSRKVNEYDTIKEIRFDACRLTYDKENEIITEHPKQTFYLVWNMMVGLESFVISNESYLDVEGTDAEERWEPIVEYSKGEELSNLVDIYYSACIYLYAISDYETKDVIAEDLHHEYIYHFQFEDYGHENNSFKCMMLEKFDELV